MSFTAICWLIVKICCAIVALFLILGFVAKKIGEKRAREESDDDIPTIHG